MTTMTDDNVVVLPVVSRLPIPVGRVLGRAQDAGLTVAVVVGESEDGSLYFASSEPDGGDILWLLEKAKLALLQAGGAWPGGDDV